MEAKTLARRGQESREAGGDGVTWGDGRWSGNGWTPTDGAAAWTPTARRLSECDFDGGGLQAECGLGAVVLAAVY